MIKLSILLVLLSILTVSTSQQIEASQYIYNLLVVQPKQCLVKHCPNQIAAIHTDLVFQTCKAQCGNNQTCWQTCVYLISNTSLLNLKTCSQKNGCYSNYQDQVQQHNCQLGIVMLMCWFGQYNPVAYQELQDCSYGCNFNEQCFRQNCPKSVVIENAYGFVRCLAKSSSFFIFDAYQPYINTNCMKDYCSSQCEAINNNPEINQMTMCLINCGDNKTCWESCVPQNQQQNLNQCVQCAQKNNCKQNFYF